MAAAFALSIAAAAPAAAQLPDLTDGGRLLSGSSNVEFPGAIAVGSVGGRELSQVDQLDPGRYAGKWYQVAAVPQPFNLQCARDTTAEYAVVDGQTISVRNNCTTAWGSESGIAGTATVTDTDTNASLRVTFPGVPGQDPSAPPNYRVTYLAEDYSLAIVGDPARTSGFVLSRTPQLSEQQWQTVSQTVADRGWWPCAFITSPTTGGYPAATPLCLR
ncbi:lipocalin family protein [Corynebacterium halotolerans]|uniref:lipocalin family protein n=1 Tax=Corynebacterium halotolerans TaxID=225326 RepID=UPI003CE75FE6